MFIVYDPEINSMESILVIFPALGTSFSMFISGVSGSYLSERAEQKIKKREMEKAMVILEDEKMEDINRSITQNFDEEIQKAMVTPININSSFDENNLVKKRKLRRKKKRTLYEKAVRFTSFIVSFTNGTAPLLGGIFPSIPFFFVQNAGISTFLISFLTIFICIVFLGILLGVISKESILKNILEMTAAFLITFLVSFLLLRV
jgi:VIT1/CCC1 family predicted Fe2+/Mn2+ transporter